MRRDSILNIVIEVGMDSRSYYPWPLAALCWFCAPVSTNYEGQQQSSGRVAH